MLLLTKSDLLEIEQNDEHITFPMLKKKSEEMAFQGSAATSSKEWSDWNVHKAF